MDAPVPMVKRPRLVEHDFILAAEGLLNSGGQPSQRVLEICERLMAIARDSAVAQDSKLMQLPCWSRLVSFLAPQSACRLAATARCSRDQLQANTREARAIFLSILGHRDSCKFVQFTSEYNDHTPFAREIISGNVDNVKFILALGVDPNGRAHNDWMACDKCSTAIPAWENWSFYDLAKVMATGSLQSGRHHRIEMLLRGHGGNSSKILCSRRMLLKRFREGHHDSCALHELFDDSLRADAGTEADVCFAQAEVAEAEEAVAEISRAMLNNNDFATRDFSTTTTTIVEEEGE